MSKIPLHFKTITEIAESIKAKHISPVEVTTAILDRIDQLDSNLKSYATVMADHAIMAAQKAETEITSGMYRGPLHGVPVAVKDLCFTKGVRTMGGTQVLAEHIPDFDSTVVAKVGIGWSGAAWQTQSYGRCYGRLQSQIPDPHQPLEC